MSVLKKIRAPVSQKLVDEFGAPLRTKKAWDGQDKDAFFRDKYAHVHAKQSRSPAKPSGVSSRPPPNPKFAQKLKLEAQKNPEREHLFGTNSILAALATRKVFKVFTGHKYNQVDMGILEKCSSLKVPLQANTPLQHLETMASHGVHNQYVALVKKREIEEFRDIEIEPHELRVGDETIKIKNKWPLGVYIDQVTDTHNMGAIIRCAYYLGADFVAFSKRNSAPISPQVIKASAGAAEFLPVFSVNSPLQLLESLKENWNVIATLPKDKASELVEVEPSNLVSLRNKACLLIVGSEDKGLRTSLAQRSTHATSLASSTENPLIDSLNVSVATALLLEKLRI